MIIFIW